MGTKRIRKATFGPEICQECGKKFVKRQPWQKFHSRECRIKSLRLTPKALARVRRRSAIKGGQSRSLAKLEAARANWRKFRPGKKSS